MQQNNERHTQMRWALWLALGGLIVVRIALMVSLPLADSTEARYGDLSRLMFQQGYWLMPHVNADTPFFAKPPLSMWISAGAVALLGLSEFALRLPHLLMAILSGVAIWLAANRHEPTSRVFALWVFASSPLVFVSAGVVMTDASQLACIAWAMLAAWRVMSDDPQANRWRLVFWLAAALGALTKGVATLALIALPLALFAVTGGGVLRTIQALLRPSAVLLFALIVLPWYVAAEYAYPGFLSYFLIGEHVMRFVDSGWSGDRYGFAHSEPLGFIWLFWAGAILPWVVVFVLQARRTLLPKAWRGADESTRWWWCWVLAPLIFFTFSSNLISTYALTSVAPFALIAARWFADLGEAYRRRVVWASVLLLPLLYLIIGWVAPRQIDAQSARALVATAHRESQATDPDIVFFERYKFSGKYYTEDQAKFAESITDLSPWLSRPGTWLITPHDTMNTLNAGAAVERVARNARATLWRVRSSAN